MVNSLLPVPGSVIGSAVNANDVPAGPVADTSTAPAKSQNPEARRSTVALPAAEQVRMTLGEAPSPNVGSVESSQL